METVRTCVGCRARRAPAALVRCVLAAEGRALVSRHGAGRGAWLCADTAFECWDQAVRRRAFPRAWRRPVDAEALTELGELLRTAVRRDDEKG